MAENEEDLISIIKTKTLALKTSQSLSELEIIYRECKGLLDRLKRTSSTQHHSALLSTLHKTVLAQRNKLRRQASKGSLLGPSLKSAKSPTTLTNTEVTHKLTQLSSQMHHEILKSEQNFQAILQSTQRLRKGNRIWQKFGGIVVEGGRLVGRLWRRERVDRILIWMAIGWYLLTVGYIAWRRLWITTFLSPILSRSFGHLASILFWLFSFIRGSGSGADIAVPNIPSDNAISESASKLLGQSIKETLTENIHVEL